MSVEKLASGVPVVKILGWLTPYDAAALWVAEGRSLAALYGGERFARYCNSARILNRRLGVQLPAIPTANSITRHPFQTLAYTSTGRAYDPTLER